MKLRPFPNALFLFLGLGLGAALTAQSYPSYRLHINNAGGSDTTSGAAVAVTGQFPAPPASSVLRWNVETGPDGMGGYCYHNEPTNPSPTTVVHYHEFDDVVFSGPAPSVSISLNFDFTVSHYQAWGTPVHPSSNSAFWSVVFYGNANSIATQTAAMAFGQGPTLVITTPTVTVPTGVPLRMVLQHRLQVVVSDAVTHATFSAMPFNLPAGYSVSSAQANISQNGFSPPVRELSPELQVPAPLVNGNPALTLGGGTPGNLGLIVAGFGAPLSGPVTVPGLPFVSVQPANPIIYGIGLLDAAGSLVAAPNLSPLLIGVPLSFQGAAFSATSAYTSNTVTRTVQ